MGKPAFFLTVPPDLLTEFDAEVRRRAYADTRGLVAWLAERGYRTTKAVVGRYTKRLKDLEHPKLGLSIPIVRALLRLMRSFQEVLDELDKQKTP